MAVLSDGPGLSRGWAVSGGRSRGAGNGWRMPPPLTARHAQAETAWHESARHESARPQAAYAAAPATAHAAPPATTQTRPATGTAPPLQAAAASPARIVTMVRMAGAVASLALMIGVGVWGYKLMMRDVTGIPVVRAMEGPMRIAPEDPGGQVTDHTGLAVNAIAAAGSAAPPEDVLTLAPAAEGLAPEDLTLAPAEPRTRGPLSAQEVLAFADAIAAGAEPMAPLDPETTSESAPEPGPASGMSASAISADIPGVAVSLRPQPRPAAMASATAAAAAENSASPAPPVLTESLPAGTTLVQFGAYDSAERAAAEWERLSGRFASFLDSHERVIQQASSGGRTFFRLRATGFADMGEARRLCTALIAEGADCVPTVEG